MKRIKFISLLLLLVLIFNMLIAAAGGSGGSVGGGSDFHIRKIMHNVYNITGQTWYTKLIDLTGYNGKNVSGTLEFELVPDTSASGTITYPLDYLDSEGLTQTVNVTAITHPGFETFKYEVPFSSYDFVDPEFNQLCNDVRSDFGIIYTSSKDGTVNTDDRNPPIKPGGFNSANDSWIKPDAPNNFGYYNEANLRNYIKLFNHAFMHEWGTAVEMPRIISKPGENPTPSDDMVIYHSAKFSRSQFKTDEEYNRILKIMNDHNLWVNWDNDPEKHVTGWECFRNLRNHEMHSSYITDPDKAIRESRRNLLSGFNTKKFSLFDYSYKKGSSSGADLKCITRPIAISKKYDASGNIVAIEKPLLPSMAQMAFERMNSYGAFNMLMQQPGGPPIIDGRDIDVEYHVFRYILKEKPSKGINLQISDDEIIVDFIFHSKNPMGFASTQPIFYVNIYKDRASADAYRYRFPKRYGLLRNKDHTIAYDFFRYTSMEFCHEITDRVQLKNKYIPSITPTPKPTPQTGDSENVWVYAALLMLSVATAVFISKKKYSNK